MESSSRLVAELARELATPTFGVVSRRQLNAAGIDRHAIRTQVRAGRWSPHGAHALRIHDAPWCPARSVIISSVLNAGASAWADGEAALVLAGFEGWRSSRIDVGLPRGSRGRAEGAVPPDVESGFSRGGPRSATIHHHCLAAVPRLLPHPVARAHPSVAALRAAAWAASDRQAATLLAMTVQQRIVRADQLLDALTLLPKLPRRALITGVLADITGGSESMGELDFVRECRRRRLPVPSRQVTRHGVGGRIHLDVLWEEAGLVVEVDGAHHFVGDAPIADALRQNDVTLQNLTVLRIPRLALRVNPEPFFAQIERILTDRGIL